MSIDMYLVANPRHFASGLKPHREILPTFVSAMKKVDQPS
jgi:hypothetical protein